MSKSRGQAKIVVIPDTCFLQDMCCPIPDNFLTQEAKDRRDHFTKNSKTPPLRLYRDLLYHLPHASMEVVVPEVILEEHTELLADGTSNNPRSKKGHSKISYAFAMAVINGKWGTKVAPCTQWTEITDLRKTETLHKYRPEFKLAKMVGDTTSRFATAFRELSFEVKDRGEKAIAHFLVNQTPKKCVILTQDSEAVEYLVGMIPTFYPALKAPRAVQEDPIWDGAIIDNPREHLEALLKQFPDYPGEIAVANVYGFFKALEDAKLLESIGFRPGITAETITQNINVQNIFLAKRNKHKDPQSPEVIEEARKATVGECIDKGYHPTLPNFTFKGMLKAQLKIKPIDRQKST